MRTILTCPNCEMPIAVENAMEVASRMVDIHIDNGTVREVCQGGLNCTYCGCWLDVRIHQDWAL